MKYDVEGYNIDNLLNTLYLKKILLTNIIRIGVDKVSFETKDRDYRKIKRFLVNFKVKYTPSIRRRLPKIFLANIGILIGVIIGSVVGVVLSKFTFQIEVFGLTELNRKDIISVLQENNVSVGKINTQSSEEIEDILLNHYDRIAQVSVIRRGTALIINLSEKLVYAEENFEPIIAKYSGVISKIHIVTGTVNVKVGEYVNKGDILVLPFNMNSDGSKVGVRPIGEIIGEIDIIGQARIDKTETRLVRTGRIIKEFKYKIFNFQFLGKSKNSFDLFETSSYNENISKVIPFKRNVTVYYELVKESISVNFEEEKEALLVKSKDTAYRDLPNGDIIDETSDIRVVGDSMFATTTIKLLGIINDTD